MNTAGSQEVNNVAVTVRQATTHPDKSGISVVGITFILFTLLTLHALVARSTNPISIGDCDLVVPVKLGRKGSPEPVLILGPHTVPSVQTGLDGVYPRGIQGGLTMATGDLVVKGDSFVWN